MSENRYSSRVIKSDEVNFVPDMEKIEFRTQKNAWSAQSLLECFDESYIIMGLFDFEKLIGFSVIYNTSFSTDLLTIGVDPDYQGRGIGRTLVEMVIGRIKDDMKPGYKVKLTLNSAKGKEPFYEKFGFRIRPNDDAGPGMDQWLTLEKRY